MPSQPFARYAGAALVLVCAVASPARAQQASALHDEPATWRRIGIAIPAMAAPFARVIAVVSVLPSFTIWSLNTLVEHAIAEVEAEGISRQDTLWLQAGSAEPGMNYLEGSNLAPPKWNGAYPSIGEPPARPADDSAWDRHRFTFELGR